MITSLEGIVNINKPVGITSFKVVSIVRKIFGAKKAGHTGTLDPNASGVLPICIGKATRIGQFLLKSNKVYLGRMKLGIRTDSQDAEGKITEKCDDFSINEEQVLDVFSRYLGEIEQIPPMFSAKKIDGKKLYQLARKGIVVEREPKIVNIASLSFLGLEDDEILFRAETSPGTYIRTLCDSIGNDLSCGAHLKSLVREKVGNMDIEDAVSLDRLQELKEDGRLNEVVKDINQALSFLPLVHVDLKTKTGIISGFPIPKREFSQLQCPFKAKDVFRVIGPNGKLVALMESLVGWEDYEKISPEVPVLKSRKVFTN